MFVWTYGTAKVHPACVISLCIRFPSLPRGSGPIFLTCAKVGLITVHLATHDLIRRQLPWLLIDRHLRGRVIGPSLELFPLRSQFVGMKFRLVLLL